MAWINQGVLAAPLLLQKVTKLSGSLAYNIRGFITSSCFRQGQSCADQEYLCEGLIVLAYYQSLSCLALTTGLVSE